MKHQDFLRLRDFESLKRWLRDGFSAEEDWREIPSRIEVAPGVWIDVPKPTALKTNEIWQMERGDR